MRRRLRRLQLGQSLPARRKFSNFWVLLTTTVDSSHTFPRLSGLSTGLTEKTAVFNWNDDCQNSFEHHRQKLITAPMLAFPDLDRPFILDTDASDKGIGAVLSQRDDNGSERVVAYASKSLSRVEQHYCVTTKRSFLLS